MADWKRAGETIRRARAKLYGTREDFAAATKLSESTLADIERGVRSNYSPDTISRIEDTLGWAPGSIQDVADGRHLRVYTDELLVRLHEAWPKLGQDARLMLTELAERVARG